MTYHIFNKFCNFQILLIEEDKVYLEKTKNMGRLFERISDYCCTYDTYRGGYVSGELGVISNNGARGVQMFLLISAILSFMSLDRWFPDRSQMNFRSVNKWLLSKSIRLVPLYYISLVLSLIIDGHCVWLGTEGHVTVPNVLFHLLFLHGLVPHYADSIIGVEWYLGVLVLFYLFVPMIYRLVNNLEKATALFVINEIGCSILCSVAPQWFPIENDPSIYNAYLGDFWFFQSFNILCMGILLYFIIKRIDEAPFYNVKTISFSFLLLSIVLLYGIMHGKGGTLYRFSAKTMFALFFCGIIISQHIYSCRVIDNQVFGWIGKYSYGIYLFHRIYIILFDRYSPFQVSSIPGGMLTVWLIKFCSCLAIVSLFSWLLSNLFDIYRIKRLILTLKRRQIN